MSEQESQPESVTAEHLPARRGPGRPGNILKVAPPRSLPERIGKIQEYHNCAIASLAQGAMYALLCGFELHAARAALRHGEWEPWVEKHCPFSSRTALRYMDAAERKVKDIPNLTRVSDFALGVSPQALHEDQRRQLIDAIKNATDGESIRQMYLDLGIITEPKARGGHHPALDPKKLTAEEALQADRKMALETWKAVGETLLREGVKVKSWKLLDPHVLDVVAKLMAGVVEDMKEFGKK